MTASEGALPVLDEESEATWALLHDQFELADGFWLGFVFSFGATAPRVLADRAEAMLRGAGRALRRWRPARPEALRSALVELVDAAREGTTDCLWVEALEEDLDRGPDGSPWSDARSEFLMRANEKRDVFVGRHRGALVLVLPRSEKNLAQERAPDLWSYREYVAELTAREPIEGLLASLDAARSVPRCEAPLSDDDLRVARDAEEVLARATRFSEAASLVLRASKALLSAGHGDHVRRMLLRLLSLPRDETTPGQLVSLALRVLAHVEVAQGDGPGALDHARAAIRCADPTETWHVVDLHRLVASVLVSQRNSVGALDAYQEAISLAREGVSAHASVESLGQLFWLLLQTLSVILGMNNPLDRALMTEVVQVGLRMLRLPDATTAVRVPVLSFLREISALESVVGGAYAASILRAALDAIERGGSADPSPSG